MAKDENIEEPAEKPAEGAEAQAKGKSPKLLIIILLAVVLAGGGFFGFKIMRAGKTAKKEAAKVGEVIELPEFLVNLSDQQTFLRTNIALGLREGAKKEELEKKMPAVKDAIVMVLTSKTPRQLTSSAGKEALKRELLDSVNAALEPNRPGAEPEEPTASADKNTDSPEKKPGSGRRKLEEKTGPVLEVYFTSFATQKP